MIIQDFIASADIVGRRLRISWTFTPEAGETLGDIPPVTLRRKQRDFGFPSPTADDPFLVYNSAAFPPAPVPGAVSVTDLDGWTTLDADYRYVAEPISVAAATGGRMVEILRRTVTTAFDLSGNALSQSVEILDTGGAPGALIPATTYYYQLFSANLPDAGDDATPYRATALVGDGYGQNRWLYGALPEVYRLHDVVTTPPAPGSDTVPELMPGQGQLRRFLDMFGIAADSLRGGAEGLRTLHDIDNVDAKFLPVIAEWLGWDLSGDVEVPLLRNELKTATRLYALVGTLPGLRALVNQFTGWFTQVAEFAQNIALANQPPNRNLFTIAPAADGASWFGGADAAELLGFGAANAHALAARASPATLTGKSSEPFALREDMTLTVAVDGLLPAIVRFGADDFADIGAATAAEVAAVIAITVPELVASADAGRIVLASHSSGIGSQIDIQATDRSLLSLDGAGTGRISALTDAAGRLRLFFEAWQVPSRADPNSAAAGAQTQRRVRYKTGADGIWRDSLPLIPQSLAQQADPAAVALKDGRLWVGWLEDPSTAATRLRYALATTPAPLPARLVGQRNEPFALSDGGVLALSSPGRTVDTFTVHAAEFADVAKASAAELVTAMNKQLQHMVALREKPGAIALTSRALGAAARLSVDFRHSTIARALGFDRVAGAAAQGSQDDSIDLPGSLNSAPVLPGYHAELCALLAGPASVRLAWSAFDHRWRIVTAHWSDTVLVATSGGAFASASGGAWTPLAGLPSADIRAVLTDADGRQWFATAAGAVSRLGTGPTVALPLPSSDLRDMVLLRDGTLCFATAAGLLLRAANGSVTVIDTGSGLPSNDVRALTAGPDLWLWAATASGLVRRDAAGVLQTFTMPDPSANAVTDVALGPDGTVYAATAAGLAMLQPGTATAVGVAGGLPSANLRGVAVAPDGTVWVATAAGAAMRAASGAWTVFDEAAGLPSNDARAVAVAPDGTAWVATAAGFSTIAGGVVTIVPLPQVGLAGRGVDFGGSAPVEITAGPAPEREPALAADASGRTWLVWTRRAGDPITGESWSLFARIYDPAAGSWGAEIQLTQPPGGGSAADRTPSLLALTSGMRVFFAADRAGGSSLWSVDVSAAGTPGAPAQIAVTTSSDTWPTPITLGGTKQLVFRSDANVALAQVGAGADQRSARLPDNGTVRRYAGTQSVDLGDLQRLRGRRLFGDLQVYTPNRPDGVTAPGPDELYTRGTVGLYVQRAQSGAALTTDEADRLRQLLQRFVPINMRAVVLIVEAPTIDYVDPTGTGIADKYSDDFPFVSVLGAVADSAAIVTDLELLHANTRGETSANPTDLTSLRHRTFFPPFT